MLKRLLGQKFGTLSAAAIKCIDIASANELDFMEQCVLAAATLDEALGAPGRETG